MTLDEIVAARPRVYEHVTPTALLRHPLLDEWLGCEAWVKHENHNPTCAFKIRGGLNLIARILAGMANQADGAPYRLSSARRMAEAVVGFVNLSNVVARSCAGIRVRPRHQPRSAMPRTLRHRTGGEYGRRQGDQGQ